VNIQVYGYLPVTPSFHGKQLSRSDLIDQENLSRTCHDFKRFHFIGNMKSRRNI